jgi:hypothetical protein
MRFKSIKFKCRGKILYGLLCIQGRFCHLEPSQAPDRPPAVFHAAITTRRNTRRGSLHQRSVSLPKRQILRHQIRHRWVFGSEYF